MIKTIARHGVTLVFSAFLLFVAHAAWAEESAPEESWTCCSSGYDCNPGQACCTPPNAASCSESKLSYCMNKLSECDLSGGDQ